jgi:hypothetical protein
MGFRVTEAMMMTLRNGLKLTLPLFLWAILIAPIANASIPEPDHLLYGTVSFDDQLLTAANSNVSIVLEFNGNEVASYTLGTNPQVQDRYLIEVPITATTTIGEQNFRPGDVLQVLYRSGSVSRTAGEMVIAARGTITELNLAVSSEDTSVIVVPNDQDGDGIPDSVELAQGLDPFDPNDAALDKDGDGISNIEEFIAGSDLSRDEIGPMLIVPGNLVVAATAMFTKVDLGAAAAFDLSDGGLTPISDGDGFYPPGEHIVTWSVSDAAGNRASETQLLSVNPMASFYYDQLVSEGDTVTVVVALNGPAASYPVTIPFTISGNAEGGGIDHDLDNGEIIIGSGLLGMTQFITTSGDIPGEAIESVIITMGQPVNAVAGMKSVFVAEITEVNIPPHVRLSVEQGERKSNIVVKGSGDITIAAEVKDSATDTQIFDWSLTDNRLVEIDGNRLDSSLTIDAAELVAGIYKVSLNVTDSAGNNSNARLFIEVLSVEPILTAADSDGDGVADQLEGYLDTDGDGIPEYLDVLAQSNALPAMPQVSGGYIVETETGLQLSLGLTSLSAGTDSAVVSFDQVGSVYSAVDSSAGGFKGGLFDFRITGLPIAGGSISIVLPQLEAIPVEAVYTKLSLSDYNWTPFVEDERNSVYSAPGAPGYCPSPGDEAYIIGLEAGYWCVMLVIEDGGPNDSDGLVNQMIDDPGGVRGAILAVPLETVNNNSGGGGGQFEFLFILLFLGIGGLQNLIKRCNKR